MHKIWPVKCRNTRGICPIAVFYFALKRSFFNI